MKKKSNILIYPFAVMGFVLLLANSCKKENLNTPVLSTSAVSSITLTTAACGGNITSDGGLTITARGVCWSTGQTPTVADSKTNDGTGAGSFTSVLTGLSPNTNYYVRAYATNSSSTGYGSTMSFSTGGGTVTDLDGNIYTTVIIGTQVWMAENLKVTKYRNGEAIPNVTDGTAWSNLLTGAYCNYNNDAINANTYGRLYNWYAVHDSRNIAPVGWHVASDPEWTTLVNSLGGDAVAGGKLKETGITHWLSPNTDATNESGFTALPACYRVNNGSFGSFGNTIWWSTTDGGMYGPYTREAYYNLSQASRSSFAPVMGLSVRCLKD